MLHHTPSLQRHTRKKSSTSGGGFWSLPDNIRKYGKKYQGCLCQPKGWGREEHTLHPLRRLSCLGKAGPSVSSIRTFKSLSLCSDAKMRSPIAGRMSRMACRISTWPNPTRCVNLSILPLRWRVLCFSTLHSNVSQDGLLPLFAGADFIVCPFDYEDKTLDSTGIFVSVLAAIRQHVGDMQARLLFVPNRIDPRVGTKEEQRMWNEAAAVLSKHGAVLPPIPARANLRRADTFEITPRQRGYVRDCFEIMLWEMTK